MDIITFIKILLIGGTYVFTYCFEIFYRLFDIHYHIPLSVYVDGFKIIRDPSCLITIINNIIHHINDPFYKIVNLPFTFKYNLPNTKWYHSILINLHQQQVPFHSIPKYSSLYRDDLKYGMYNLAVDKPLIFNFFSHQKYQTFGSLLSTPTNLWNPIYKDIITDLFYKKVNNNIAMFYHYKLSSSSQGFINVWFKPNGAQKYYESICQFLLQISDIKYEPIDKMNFLHFRDLILQHISTIQSSEQRYRAYSYFIHVVKTNNQNNILDFINEIVFSQEAISFNQFNFNNKSDQSIKRLHYFKMLYTTHLNYIFDKLDIIDHNVFPSAINIMHNIKGPLNEEDLNFINGFRLRRERSFDVKLIPSIARAIEDLSKEVNYDTTYEQYMKIKEGIENFDIGSYNYMENYNYNKNRAKMPYSILYKEPSLNFDYLSLNHNKMSILTEKNTKFTYEFFQNNKDYEIIKKKNFDER